MNGVNGGWKIFDRGLFVNYIMLYYLGQIIYFFVCFQAISKNFEHFCCFFCVCAGKFESRFDSTWNFIFIILVKISFNCNFHPCLNFFLNSIKFSLFEILLIILIINFTNPPQTPHQNFLFFIQLTLVKSNYILKLFPPPAALFWHLP